MSIPSDRDDASLKGPSQWERELLFDFAVSEVHLGIALAGAARAAYDHGQIPLGDDARKRAEAIISRARELAQKLIRGGVDPLAPHLDQLQKSLDALVRPVAP